jgi:hypothetical protein
MAHEVFDREEKIKGSSDRNFGLVMGAFFLLVALAPLLHKPLLHQPVRWWAVGVAIAFAALAHFWTRPLAPLNLLWTKFGLLLHAIVSPIMLAAIFYVSVVPIGLILRAFGKDLLRLKRHPDAASYWIERLPPGPDPITMKNQF